MTKHTRKEFLKFGALLGATSARAQSSNSGTAADLAVVRARVYTMDAARPEAEAFAVKNGRIVAVGSTADIRNIVTPATRVIDAAGMTVTPGFIDAHCHPSGVEELYGVNANVRSIAAIQDGLRQRAASTPPGDWIEAFLFDDTKLDDGRALHRRDLDAAAPDHPVSVAHRGGHTTWYNSQAFALAGITRATPDPANGRYFRDPDGELTGKVAELARDVFEKVGRREQFTPLQLRDRNRSGMRYMSELFAAAGLTSVHDAMCPVVRMTAYQDARAHGELHHRAYIMAQASDLYPGLKAAGLYTGFGDEWVRLGGVKFVADGSASERTMRMSTPYVGTNDYGILTMTQQQIDDGVEDAHRHNFQVGIHANGDVTIDMVLKAYERVLAKLPRADARHRIEHCTLMNPGLLQRIKASGCIPTPFWTYVYYHGEKWSQYGDDKLQWMFAHRSFLDYGIPVAGASDYPPGPFEPLMALQSMVTRTDYKGRTWGPNQKITVAEALRVATINGAHASFEENSKGSITQGKLADFVMLERDPHKTSPDQLKDIKVVRTVVGGRTTYPKGEA